MRKILIMSFLFAMASMPAYCTEKVKPFELYTEPQQAKKEPYHSNFADNYYKGLKEQSADIYNKVGPNDGAPILFVIPITQPGAIVIDNAFVK